MQIFPANAQSGDVRMVVLAPQFMDNLEAQAKAAPNETSGILILGCDARRIVFPGDATIDEWRVVHGEVKKPIQADVLAVPHHGGLIWRRKRTTESDEDYAARVAEDLDWLLRDVVRPTYAVVSAGTTNTYGHPRPDVISALRRAGVHLLCTQITPQCWKGKMTALRRHMLPPLHASRSGQVSKKTATRGIGCATTVVADITPTTVSIRRFHEHQAAVDNLQKRADGCPLCRATS